MSPTFSIVVPAYRTGPIIAETIESVLAQTRADWELLIVDDCSPDGVAPHVEPFLGDERIRAWRLPENRGVSGARNAGIAEARGELVCFLDSDDLIRPRFLDTVADAALAAPDVAIIGVRPAVVDEVGEPTSLTHLDEPWPADPTDTAAWLLHLLALQFHFRGTTVPRAVLAELGGFDEGLWMGEDLEFWVRAVALGRPVAVVDRPDYVYRRVATSLTRQADGTVDVSRAFLRALDRIEDDVRPVTDRRPDVAAAVADARRRCEAQEATGLFRRAAREGDGPTARRHARRYLSLEPGVRSAAACAVAYLPGRLLRATYDVNRRRRGLQAG